MTTATLLLIYLIVTVNSNDGTDTTVTLV